MVLTATAVAVISAIGIASCVALNTAQDIYVLGKLYEGYVNDRDTKEEGYAAKIQNLFDTGVKVVGDKVQVCNELILEAQAFYESVFNVETPNLIYLPVDFPLYRYISVDELKNVLGYYFTQIYGEANGKHVRVGGLAETGGYYGLEVVLDMPDSTSSSRLYGSFYKWNSVDTNVPAAYGWDVAANAEGKRYLHIFSITRYTII